MAASIHTVQSSLPDYGDHVRTRYPDLFNSAIPVSSQVHWLQQVLNPLQRGTCPVLPDSFGASLIGFIGDQAFLKWSTCFEDKGNNLSYRELDESQLATITDDLLSEIDELCATSETQVLVLHCFPEGSGTGSMIWYSKMEDVIDAIGARLDINPWLFIEHFDKLGRYCESTAQALPSDRDYVQLEHPAGGYISATSGNAHHGQTSMAIVIDSSMLVRNHAHFLPTMRSYMGTTFNSLRGRKSPKNSIYHLTPYMEYLLRISLAAIKNSHSCTDMGCKAMPRTWQELQSLSRLLRANLISIQQLLVREGLDPSAISSEPINRLLSDSMTVAENAVAHTASIERQAQLQTSELAAREAEETYKQARSMEKLTTIAWIYIPLSFSATFFGMNVAQLNDSGPNIGYFFLLLIISLLIAACTAILYTDWWREVTLAWRAWVQPGHDCHPRELGVAHLLWITVHWAAKKIFCILGMRKKKKKRESDPDDGSELS